MANFSHKIFSKETSGELCMWLVFFIAFGYPVTVSIPVFLGLASSTPINVGFRALYVGIAIFLILTAVLRADASRLYKGSYLILAFWFIYSSRLLYDTAVEGLIPSLKSSFYIYSFAFGNGLLPVIAIILAGKYVNLKTTFKKLWLFLLLGNCLTIFLLLKLNGFSPDLFASRARLTLDQGGNSIDVLNPILLGYYGEVLALVAISRLLLSKREGLMTKLLLYASMGLGMLNLILGASRGPFVSFVLILLVIIAFHLRRSKKGVLYFMKAGVVVAALLYLSITLLVPFLAETKMVKRFEFLLEVQDQTEGVSFEARDINYVTAWEQFKENPILGDQYLLTWGGYPHNIYLEVLMATGLIGALFFYGFFFYIFKKSFQIWRYYTFDTFIILVVTMTAILAHATSGNLYAGVAFWVLIAFLSTINVKKIRFNL